MKKSPLYYYNTSDIGYMDEEWLDYIPETIKEELEKEKEKQQVVNEEQVKEVH